MLNKHGKIQEQKPIEPVMSLSCTVDSSVTWEAGTKYFITNKLFCGLFFQHISQILRDEYCLWTFSGILLKFSQAVFVVCFCFLGLFLFLGRNCLKCPGYLSAILLFQATAVLSTHQTKGSNMATVLHKHGAGLLLQQQGMHGFALVKITCETMFDR